MSAATVSQRCSLLDVCRRSILIAQMRTGGLERAGALLQRQSLDCEPGSDTSGQNTAVSLIVWGKPGISWSLRGRPWGQGG